MRRELASRWIDRGVGRRARRRPRRGARGRRPACRSAAADVAQAARAPGVAADHDVEHLLLLEQAADLDARQQRRRRAAHVARLDPVALRLGEVDLDRDASAPRPGARRAGRRRRRRRPAAAASASACARRTPRSSPKTRTTSGRRSAPVSTSRSALRPRVAGLPVVERRDVADPLLLVGQHVVREARVAVDDVARPRPASRRSRRRGRADPQLAGVDVDDLVAGDGAADVAADVATPGTARSSRLARGDDPPHLRARRARAAPSRCTSRSRSWKEGITRAVERAGSARCRRAAPRPPATSATRGRATTRPTSAARSGRRPPRSGDSRRARARLRQQQQAQRRREGQRDQHRRHHREHVGARRAARRTSRSRPR